MTQKPGEFTRRVCQLARQIPPGRVTTYGYLAVAAGGRPMMSRMITSILSKAPDANTLPFHRIVYSNGKVWLTPECRAERLRLYQEEGIEIGSHDRIKDFDKIVYLFK